MDYFIFLFSYLWEVFLETAKTLNFPDRECFLNNSVQSPPLGALPLSFLCHLKLSAYVPVVRDQRWRRLQVLCMVFWAIKQVASACKTESVLKKYNVDQFQFQLCLISSQIDSDHFFPRQTMMLYICMYMCVCMYVFICKSANWSASTSWTCNILCSDSFRALSRNNYALFSCPVLIFLDGRDSMLPNTSDCITYRVELSR